MKRPDAVEGVLLLVDVHPESHPTWCFPCAYPSLDWMYYISVPWHTQIHLRLSSGSNLKQLLNVQYALWLMIPTLVVLFDIPSLMHKGRHSSD